jgi:hypothetical protein
VRIKVPLQCKKGETIKEKQEKLRSFLNKYIAIKICQSGYKFVPENNTVGYKLMNMS